MDVSEAEVSPLDVPEVESPEAAPGGGPWWPGPPIGGPWRVDVSDEDVPEVESPEADPGGGPCGGRSPQGGRRRMDVPSAEVPLAEALLVEVPDAGHGMDAPEVAAVDAAAVVPAVT